MAMSVNPAIEGYLSAVMGHLDPAAMIRPRSTGPIKASGHAVPQQQAVHMTAAGRTLHTREKSLASRGPSTHDSLFQLNGTGRRMPGMTGGEAAMMPP
ncbi:MAG TPA: hypothetical protein VJ747_05080 [Stellaceae bacterium]|nr:hypothetical protein [Stellaceae bacterium]